MTINKLYITALISILLSLGTIAQKSGATGNTFKYKHPHSKKPTNYINSIKGTLLLGGASYYGDLCSGMECVSNQNIALGLGLQYRMTRHVAMRLEFTYFQITGEDSQETYPDRNLSFKANNIDISAVGIYDIFPYIKMFRRRHSFAPYGFAGIGMVSYNPKAELDGTTHKLREVQTEGVEYSKYAFNIPFGLGVRYKAGPHLDVSAELGYHWTFTDYLDDVSSEYPDTYESSLQQSLSDKRLTSSSNQRGNSEKNDGFFIFGFRAEYTIKVPRQHYNLHSKNAKFKSHRGVRR